MGPGACPTSKMVPNTPMAAPYWLARHMSATMAAEEEVTRASPRPKTRAAASNGPYEQQLHRLALAGMKDCFTYFFISERIGASKPSLLFFDAAFREVNEGREVSVTPAEAAIDKLKADTATNGNTRPLLDHTANLLRITGGKAGFLNLVRRT